MTNQRWVLIESGSTQDFIFQSNRQRFQVGASGLVADLPTWVQEAVHSTNSEGLAIVSAISASAVLLADSVEAGQKVVRAVSERALLEAPGLDVWGYVEPDDAVAQGKLMDRLTGARHGLNRARIARSAARSRFPMTPFSGQCTVTGLPAVGTLNLLGAQDQPVSALTDAVWQRAARAHTDWLKLLGAAVVSNLDRDLNPEGWVAVIHADGNGIGSVIDQLESPDEYAAFSQDLEAATRTAFKDAVGAVSGKQWLLPIIIGGDDVTLICQASQAAEFTRAYLLAFEARTSGIGPGGESLTASAGVAYIKPHYPFSEAYALAEQLTRSAKKGRSRLRADNRSAWDFHVLHDALSRPLDEIRSGHRHAIVSPLLASDPGPVQTKGQQADHEDQPIMAAVRQLIANEPPLSNKAQHALRSALLQPLPHRDAEVARVKERAIDIGGVPAATFLKEHLDDRMKNGPSSLLTVMDLVDVITGTSRTEG